MSSISTPGETLEPGVVLKITPPKLRKSLLARERLRAVRTASDVAVFFIEAPAGYGKTSALSQWRLDWLQAGAVVAWLCLDVDDTPVAVVGGIVEGLRRAHGSKAFGDVARATLRTGATLPSLTALLAEIVESAKPTVLVFDDCERVADAGVLEVFDYLLHNLPPNLTIAAGSRTPLSLRTTDLAAEGTLRRLTPADLRLDVRETTALLAQRLGSRADADLGTRLHEITEGWPLGVQLAAAALERSDDWDRTLQVFAESRDDTTRQFLAGMVAALLPERLLFLTRCALLDALHPGLCEALTEEEDAALWLRQLLAETPLLTAVADSEWVRMHPLAREFLRARAQEVLPAHERDVLHLRAARWLATHDLPLAAATHTFAAGDADETARLLIRIGAVGITHGYRQSMGLVLRLPADVFTRQPALRALLPWALTLQGQIVDAVALADELVRDPALEPSIAQDSIAVMQYAALTRDDIGGACRALSLVPAHLEDSRLRRMACATRSLMAIYEGATDAARRYQEINLDDGKYVGMHMLGLCMLGLSHLWDGHPSLAEQVLRKPQANFDARFGRHAVYTATVAIALAAACWEQDQREAARMLLADRLDAIAHAGTVADMVCLAYETLARIAGADGDPRRPFALLEELAASGRSRGVVRFRVVSLTERIRMHAAAHQPSRCDALLTELAELMNQEVAAPPLLMPLLQLHCAMARAYTALAHGDAPAAAMHLEHAGSLASRIKRARESVQVAALRALVAERSGSSGSALLAEALALAEAGEMVRVFADTLPELLDTIRRWAGAAGSPASGVTRGFIDRVLATATASASVVAPGRVEALAAGSVLTPKEAEVLKLLAAGMPNKRIAASMGLSAETVKWHMKKLFTKLDAGSREHAVERARLQGLI